MIRTQIIRRDWDGTRAEVITAEIKRRSMSVTAQALHAVYG